MSLTPEELGRKIKEASGQPAMPTKGKPVAPATARAARAATDLFAALVVGAFLGYWIDRWLGTKPWGMIILFFGGFAAGFLNIYRSQMGQSGKDGKE
jgi:ATP synthase protein I